MTPSRIARPVHAALVAADGVEPGRAALSDKGRIAVVLEAAGLLALLEACGWRLARGWRGAAVDSDGRLTGVVVAPGREEKPAARRLVELVAALFSSDDEAIAGRGEARRAARRLIERWRPSLAPGHAETAIADLFELAPFLRESPFSASRERLAGAIALAGAERPWRVLAGAAGSGSDSAASVPPPRPRLPETACDLATRRGREARIASARERPPRDAAETLELADAMALEGSFAAALLLVAGERSAPAERVRAAAHAGLGELGAAREAIRRFERAAPSLAERFAATDTALRVLANGGDLAAARAWAERLLIETGAEADAEGDPSAGALAHLAAGTVAADLGDGAATARHLAAARRAAARTQDGGSRLAARIAELEMWAALAEGDGERGLAGARTRLAHGRRALSRVELGRLWNNVGVCRDFAHDLAGAERAFLRAARHLRRVDGPLALTLAETNLAEIRLRRGRPWAVEPILAASLAHNRRSGNRRGLAHDALLRARFATVLGRPEAALALCEAALAELERDGLAWQRGELAIAAARILGWLGRAGEAAARLAGVADEALRDLEPEELPALWALAGDRARALAAADATGTGALWRALVAGDRPRDETLAPWRALESYRQARAVLDAERVAPGAMPESWRRTAAATFARRGALRWASELLPEEGGAWRALAAYLDRPPGDPEAFRELARLAGHPEARLVRRSGTAERVLVAGDDGAAIEVESSAAPGRVVVAVAVADDAARALALLAGRDFAEAIEPAAAAAPGPIVGESPALRAAVGRLEKLAAAGDLPILVLGESGTGKELAARWVHRASARRDATFLAINCAALPETLILSELFGHVRGAFTGADRDHVGLFEAARGGTLFLDEIGDLPATAQGNLLRVLQEGEIRRVGESRPRKVDVRVVAATHRDLPAMVEQGTFRRDLDDRLKVGTALLPALAERGDDVQRLADHFLGALRLRWPEVRLSTAARRALAAHRWPGNVRELQNTLLAAAALADGRTIEPQHLDLGGESERAPARRGGGFHAEVARFRERLLVEALAASGGNLTRAAQRLGLSRQALSYLVAKLGLERK